MSEGHHHHHASASQKRERVLWFSVGLTGLFMVVEFIAGWWSHSLALMADAVHMLADTGALGLALFAVRLSGRIADDHRTFGYGRMQVLAAFINGLAVLGLGSFLFARAVRRLWSPVEVESGIMMWVALAGLIVNLVILMVLHRGESRSVNIRAAIAHVMGDMLSSVAVIVAAFGISETGWSVLDPVATMVVALLIARSAKDILSESGHILLEGRPPNLKLGEVSDVVKAAVPEVVEVHHLHAWSLSGEDVLMTLHARLTESAVRSDDEILQSIKTVLNEHFHIHHSTVQLERSSCADGCAHTHPA